VVYYDFLFSALFGFNRVNIHSEISQEMGLGLWEKNHIVVILLEKNRLKYEKMIATLNDSFIFKKF
jgi:hypothetical protein